MTTQRPPFSRRFLTHPKELAGWIAGRPGYRRVKVATTLRFLHEVMGLDRLHFGLWDGESLSLDGLKAAQSRYSERLLSWIPEGVHRILDVGVGTGTDVLELSRLGYEIEGLSPDPYQHEVFLRRSLLPLHLGRFQEFRAASPYDLILMSESSQYIWIEVLFEKARELAPGGYLLLADYFLRQRTGPRTRKTAHPLREFRQRAAAASFEVIREEDVTEAVAPTLELGASWAADYVEPALRILAGSLAARHPSLYAVGRWLLRRPIGTLLEKRRLLDSEEFKQTHCYLFMLLRAVDPNLSDGGRGGVHQVTDS